MDIIQKKLSDFKKPNYVNYEEIIKNLVPVITNNDK